MKLGAKANYQCGLLERSTTSAGIEGVLVGTMLVNIQEQHIPLRVVNLSHQQRMISKGAVLAHYENVKSVHIPEANVH